MDFCLRVNLTLHYVRVKYSLRSDTYPYMAFTIQNKIAQLRQERQLLQEDVAKAVEVSRQTMSALEKGSYIPSLLLAMRLARYFEVSIDELFSLEKIV